ncbi:MAG TPA: Hsp20/alpha crystallin family protein [Burkholderiales bacterium]
MNRLVTRNEGAPLSRWGFFGDDFDRVFEGFFRPLRWVEEATSDNFVPAMDIKERENEYVVRADLPGVRKEDISVTLENGLLTIAAERKAEEVQKEGERELRRECRYGRYVRSLRLGTQIDEKKVKASYRDGVLELTLPKAEEVKPRKIEVEVG